MIKLTKDHMQSEHHQPAKTLMIIIIIIFTLNSLSVFPALQLVSRGSSSCQSSRLFRDLELIPERAPADTTAIKCDVVVNTAHASFWTSRLTTPRHHRRRHHHQAAACPPVMTLLPCCARIHNSTATHH